MSKPTATLATALLFLLLAVPAQANIWNVINPQQQQETQSTEDIAAQDEAAARFLQHYVPSNASDSAIRATNGSVVGVHKESLPLRSWRVTTIKPFIYRLDMEFSKQNGWVKHTDSIYFMYDNDSKVIFRTLNNGRARTKEFTLPARSSASASRHLRATHLKLGRADIYLELQLP